MVSTTVIIVLTIIISACITWRGIDGFCLPLRKYSYPTSSQVLHATRQKTKQPRDDLKENEQQTTNTKKQWIIVVEDEDFLRNAIGKYVSKEGGYHVTGVADARSCFLLCRGIFKPTSNRYTSFQFDPNYNASDSAFERPDCIVLDVRLGGEMDGIQLLNVIRSDALLESLPVVLLTAKGKVDDRIAGYQAGADAYLTKPFDPEELLSVLEGVLRRKNVVSSESDPAIRRVTSTNSMDSMMPIMKEIQREIMEIKSLLRQRKNATDSTASNHIIEDENNTSTSFVSMYNDLLEMKEEIKATSNMNVVDNDAAAQIILPKVTLDNINELYFTPDEQKVINLVEKGLTNKEIGEEYMNCSISKVEKIVSSLFKKTGTKKRPELVNWCKQNEQGGVIVVDDTDDIPKSSKKLKEDKEIMDLIGKGFTNKEIVNKTGVSLKDIVTVIDAMLDEAKVKNRTELMRWWNSKENKLSS